MRCVSLFRKLAGCFFVATVATGMFSATASAQNYCCPPRYYNCPPGYGAAAGAPTMASPDSASPSSPMNPMDPTAAAPQTPADPLNQPQTQQDINFNATQNAGAGDVASAGGGANVGHIGRLDSNFRLNIFDSQSAVPMNRVWYSFQYADGYTSGIGAAGQPNVTLHRVGAEVKLWDTASFVTQGEYVNFGGGAVDRISNPQFMVKQILWADCDTVVSATLSSTVPVNFNALTISERTVRLAPGLLFYHNTTDRIFNYGGVQFNIPLASDQITTLDWAFGTGYWVYESCCCCDWLQKVSAQWEIFGKHVTSDNVIGNGGGPPGAFGFAGNYTEGRNTVDMTFGATAFIRCNWRVASGVSIPVTTTDTRNFEFITTVGYFF